MLFLNRAYQVADLSLVYPLARGAAPFIVAVVSVWFLGEQLSQTGILAILLIGLGITSLILARGATSLRDWRPILLALVTGAFIGSYTIVDGLGARAAGSAHGYRTSELPPRDPPFGKGNPGNDGMHEPNSAGSKYSYSPGNQIPPRDPPFGKGDADNDTTHLPSSATTRGMASDGTGTSTKKNAATKSAMKKDATKKDAAPKTDTN